MIIQQSRIIYFPSLKIIYVMPATIGLQIAILQIFASRNCLKQASLLKLKENG